MVIPRKHICSALLLSMLLSSAPLSAAELYEEKKVSQIQIEFNCPDPTASFDSKPVLSKMKTKPGDDFSQSIFDNDLKALSDEYDCVQPSLSVQDERVAITIRVCPRSTIHEILFSGNEKYSTSTLKKELDVKPYSIFNRQEFNKSFNKLKEFYIKKGYFESQLSYTTVPIPNTNEVDVKIEIREGKSGHIRKIVFKGFTKSEQSELEDLMYLKQYNFLTSWLTGTGTLRDEALEQDRMTITNLLQNRGYADAKVDILIQDDPFSDKVIIEIIAERGELYRFGSVTIEGNTLYSSEELLKRSVIEPNAVFSPDKVRDSSQAMKDFYGQKGYIDASVQYETALKEDCPVFDVHFSVDEGAQYKIGMIHIFGNHTTQNSVILRESLLVPGETFDSRKLKATQQRLEAIGYFKTVNVFAVRSNDDLGLGSNYRDVYIEVEETPTGNVSLFGGFSSADDIFGGLDLTERNFNIAGLPKMFRTHLHSLRGGGQYFHMRATVGKKQTNFLISWVNPYVNDSLWRLGVELSQTISDLQTKNVPVYTYGGSVFANYPLSTYWTFGMRERLRHTQNTVKIHKGDSVSPKDAERMEESKEKNQGHGLLSAVSTNIAYDSTDSGQKPHKGWRSYLEAELSGVGGNYRFWKFSYLNSIYFPVSAKGTFKLRGEVRFLAPFGSKKPERNVPYSERLFLGGEGSVRGYRPFSLGPKMSSAEDSEKTPKGGLSSCLLSAEYNYQLIKLIDVFFFFDAGNVEFSPWTIRTLQTSAGAGVRLEINKGTPIVLGYGYPFNPTNDFEVQKFFFSMGGQF